MLVKIAMSAACSFCLLCGLIEQQKGSAKGGGEGEKRDLLYLAWLQVKLKFLLYTVCRGNCARNRLAIANGDSLFYFSALSYYFFVSLCCFLLFFV